MTNQERQARKLLGLLRLVTLPLRVAHERQAQAWHWGCFGLLLALFVLAAIVEVR